MNLLKETIAVLNENGKTEADVLWCGSKNGFFSWEEFKKLADLEYDNGYGGQIIARDILVVGENWWLERFEYDGSECWSFKSLPEKPETEKIPVSLASGCGWEYLYEIEEGV